MQTLLDTVRQPTQRCSDASSPNDSPMALRPRLSCAPSLRLLRSWSCSKHLRLLGKGGLKAGNRMRLRRAAEQRWLPRAFAAASPPLCLRPFGFSFCGGFSSPSLYRATTLHQCDVSLQYTRSRTEPVVEMDRLDAMRSTWVASRPDTLRSERAVRRRVSVSRSSRPNAKR